MYIYIYIYGGYIGIVIGIHSPTLCQTPALNLLVAENIQQFGGFCCSIRLGKRYLTTLGTLGGSEAIGFRV